MAQRHFCISYMVFYICSLQQTELGDHADTVVGGATGPGLSGGEVRVVLSGE